MNTFFILIIGVAGLATLFWMAWPAIKADACAGAPYHIPPVHPPKRKPAMTDREFFTRLRKHLDAERDDLFVSNVNLGTGKIDDAQVREWITELDLLINEIDKRIPRKEPAHV